MIRNTSSSIQSFYFIRHSVSYKTLEDRHGGDGQPLTEQGRLDAKYLSKFLSQEIPHSIRGNSKIFISGLPQVQETAEVISENLSIPKHYDVRLRNASLGLLSGLSKEEAMTKYPEYALSLERWRKGEIPINEVNIPNFESTYDFQKRIFSFLHDVFAMADLKTAIIVGTRSSGLMLTNILLGYHKNDESKYVRYLFDPSSVTKFRITDYLLGELQFHNRTDFLPSPPQYPDA